MHDPLVVAFEIPRPWPGRLPFTQRLYWPALITVWHREPGDHDAGEVCRHHASGRIVHGWRWHVHHWRIQVHPAQQLRRRLLTRCAHCGGRSTKTRPVNVALGGQPRRTPWWRGEAELYHFGCGLGGD